MSAWHKGRTKTLSEEIKVEINAQSYSCESGTTLLNVILNHELLIETACGGKGTCHLCRVKLTSTPKGLEEPTKIEHRALGNVLLNEGLRLSCQVTVVNGLKVELPKYETRAERRARRAKSRKKG